MRPDNRTEGDTLAMGTRRPTGSSPLQLVMSLAGALVLAVVQLSGVVDAEWTDYLPHETCGAVHALTPRVLFYSPQRSPYAPAVPTRLAGQGRTHRHHLPLPPLFSTHFHPPPPQNSRSCTRARTRSGSQTHKQHRLP